MDLIMQILVEHKIYNSNILFFDNSDEKCINYDFNNLYFYHYHDVFNKDYKLNENNEIKKFSYDGPHINIL